MLPVVVALVVDGNLAEAVVVVAVVVAVDRDSCLGCIAGVVHGSLFDVDGDRGGGWAREGDVGVFFKYSKIGLTGVFNWFF